MCVMRPVTSEWSLRQRPPSAEQAPHQATVPPFSWLAALGVKPYPPGQGNADGLSRNIDDCNKGCIGVNTVR